MSECTSTTELREAAAAWQELRDRYNGEDWRGRGSLYTRVAAIDIIKARTRLESAHGWMDASGMRWVPIISGVHIPGSGGSYRVEMPSVADIAREVVRQCRELSR